MRDKDSLIGMADPQPNSTIMIYDVHASESGALAILNDLYEQIRKYEDKTIHWIFIVSTPKFKETDNIKVYRFPWTKINWGYRYYFDTITTRKLLSEFKPDKVFSLQNKGIPFYHGEQIVYLHLPFILTDHKFNIKTDGKKLWLYQNMVSKSIFKSLQKVDYTIVQTHWMKDALVRKAGVDENKIVIQEPDISTNDIKKYIDSPENRRRIFYPATAFTYKNHITLLKAIKSIQDKVDGYYEVIFTILPYENEYTKMLCNYVKENNLNVKFIGAISREQVFEMYAQSILVFPSYVESFGLPLLEAKLSETFIIASDTPYCHEILEGYQRASFFEELDYKALGQLLLRSWENANIDHNSDI